MKSNDTYNLITCIYREARGESRDAKRGVYWVIMNRVKESPKNHWPSDISGVILQPKQFSSFNANDPNFVKYPQAGGLQLTDICDVVDNPGDDNTQGSNAYHSYPIGHPAWPRWATDDKFTVKIGNFSFYKL